MGPGSSLHADLGVFDSGIGGVSVLHELRLVLPATSMIYVADSKHLPYGQKSADFIRERSRAIVRFLVETSGCKTVVVACNTATTHAVDTLRREFEHVPFVGMEPAIKPAVHATRSGIVGILATEATLAGERVVKLIDRTARGVTVLTQPCPGLVEQVEAGELQGPRTVDLIERYARPLINRGADTLVLGCTHYTFLQEAIRQVAGPSVALLDSAVAVARHSARVLSEHTHVIPIAPIDPPPVVFFTSGEPDRVRPVLEQVWRAPVDLQPLPV